MQLLESAVPVARTLLAVADTRRDVDLEFRLAGGRCATAVVRGGVLRAVRGVAAEPLGDLLLRYGALDMGRHGRALRLLPPRGAVGVWLVAVGAAPQAAVERALREQLQSQLRELLAWGQLPGARPPAQWTGAGYEVQLDLVEAVCVSMLLLARGDGAWLSQPSDAALWPTKLGERLLSRAAVPGLSCDAWPVRQMPTTVERVLRLIGLVTVRAGQNPYSLLLRKQCEMRRRNPPRALLDLPSSADPEQGRAAFRRLAGALHPDRFACDAPSLMAASNEVLRALSSAEHALRQTS